jgi:hypothetical protein
MVRRNPDAVALCVIGLILLIGSVPSFLIRQAEWQVKPLKMEMQIPKEDLRALHDQLQAQKDEMRRQAEELRRSLHQ